MAGLLALRGVSVVAFDRLDDLYPLPRAIGFDHEFMRVMQELGVADEVLSHTAEYRPSEYRGVDGTLIRRFDVAPPPHLLGWAPNYVFDQPSVERVIRQRLTQFPNVAIELATCVESIVQEPDGVAVTAHAGTDPPSNTRLPMSSRVTVGRARSASRSVSHSRISASTSTG